MTYQDTPWTEYNKRWTSAVNGAWSDFKNNIRQHLKDYYPNKQSSLAENKICPLVLDECERRSHVDTNLIIMGWHSHSQHINFLHRAMRKLHWYSLAIPDLTVSINQFFEVYGK